MKKTKKIIKNLLASTKATVNKSKVAHKQLVAKFMFNKKLIITEDGVGRK